MTERKQETDTRKRRASGESEFDRFSGFMKRLVAVPHSEIKAKLDAEKKAKARKSSRTSASRASHGGD
jgi:hypothetical protein